MESITLTALETSERHVARDGRVVVVLLYVRHDRAVPHGIETVRDSPLAALVPTAVTDEDDVAEAVHLETVCDVGKHRLERFLTHGDRARTHHVTAGRVDVALGHELDDGGAERVSELVRDRVAVGVKHVVVLARRQPRAVRFDPAGGNNDGGHALCERIADVHPRHLLDPDRVGRRKRVGRVGTVVHIGRAVAPAHRVGIALLLGLGGTRGEEQGTQGQDRLLHDILQMSGW